MSKEIDAMCAAVGAWSPEKMAAYLALVRQGKKPPLPPEVVASWQDARRAAKRQARADRWGEGAALLPRAVAFLVRHKGQSGTPLFEGKTAWEFVRAFGPPGLGKYFDGLGTNPDNWEEVEEAIRNAKLPESRTVDGNLVPINYEPGTFRMVNLSAICERLIPYWSDLGDLDDDEALPADPPPAESDGGADLRPSDEEPPEPGTEFGGVKL